MFKARAAFVAVIVAALALVAGFSSAPVSAATLAKTRIVITSMAPAQPVAGAPFTMTFQLHRRGTPIAISDIDCFGTIGGKKFVPTTEQGHDGTTGRCTWLIPSDASGKTFDGVLSARRASNGVWYFHGFDLPIT